MAKDNDSKPSDTPLTTPPPTPVVLADKRPVLPDGLMEVATCWLKRNELGDNVPLGQRDTPSGFGYERGVTPAEMQVLRSSFQVAAKGEPIQELKIFGTVKRTPAQEKQRLLRIYRKEVVDALFPGVNPPLPKAFTDVETDFPEPVEVGQNFMVHQSRGGN